MRTAKLQSVLVFAMLALTLTACSMEASIQSLVPDIGIFKAPGQAHGITSGSGQMKSTSEVGTGLNKYKVSSSVGVVGSTSPSTTNIYYQTSGGYKVYGTVQGAIVAQ